MPCEQSGRMLQKNGTYQKIYSIHDAFKCCSLVKREKKRQIAQKLSFKWVSELSLEQKKKIKSNRLSIPPLSTCRTGQCFIPLLEPQSSTVSARPISVHPAS